jgi:hypothetical protein
MQSNRSIEPLDPTDRDKTSRSSRGPVAKLLAVIRGDKYVADAYEPAWSALVASRSGAGPAAPAASTQQEP